MQIVTLLLHHFKKEHHKYPFTEMILLPLQMVGDMLACLQKKRGKSFHQILKNSLLTVLFHHCCALSSDGEQKCLERSRVSKD